MLQNHIDRIESAVKEVTGYDLEAIKTGGRSTTELLFARILFAHELGKLKLYLSEIGKIINRNHTTINYYRHVYSNEYATNAFFREVADKVRGLLG